MKKKFYVIAITIMVLIIGVTVIPGMSSFIEEDANTSKLKENIILEDNWYWLPGYPNYAPNGMPDFNQKQHDSWVNILGHKNFCLPTAISDVLWWLDSKHSDPTGTPGDGKDICPLVKNYNAPSTPNPGPKPDDHNFNNVDDNKTPYRRFSKTGELVERLARYIGTPYFIINPILVLLSQGIHLSMFGVKKWIREVGLQNEFKVEFFIKPSFETISERLLNDEGIVLGVGGWTPNNPPFYIWGHAVALAGINTKEQKIAISDPWMDVSNNYTNSLEAENLTSHNNASIVSHDIYDVFFDTPHPRVSSWWLPKYFEEDGGSVVFSAIIISDRVTT